MESKVYLSPGPARDRRDPNTPFRVSWDKRHFFQRRAPSHSGSPQTSPGQGASRLSSAALSVLRSQCCRGRAQSGPQTRPPPAPPVGEAGTHVSPALCAQLGPCVSSSRASEAFSSGPPTGIRAPPFPYGVVQRTRHMYDDDKRFSWKEEEETSLQSTCSWC